MVPEFTGLEYQSLLAYGFNVVLSTRVSGAQVLCLVPESSKLGYQSVFCTGNERDGFQPEKASVERDGFRK